MEMYLSRIGKVIFQLAANPAGRQQETTALKFVIVSTGYKFKCISLYVTLHMSKHWLVFAQGISSNLYQILADVVSLNNRCLRQMVKEL
jgi:hypothetical protein